MRKELQSYVDILKTRPLTQQETDSLLNELIDNTTNEEVASFLIGIFKYPHAETTVLEIVKGTVLWEKAIKGQQEITSRLSKQHFDLIEKERQENEAAQNELAVSKYTELAKNLRCPVCGNPVKYATSFNGQAEVRVMDYNGDNWDELEYVCIFACDNNHEFYLNVEQI